MGHKFSVKHDYVYCSNNVSMFNFKLAFLNICGLSSKLNIPEFSDFIECYNIVGLAETRLSNYEQLDIYGYTIFPRQYQVIKGVHNRRVKHGGVCLFIKNDIVHLCREVELNVTKHYDGILWCLVGVILIGVVYVPPARSVNLDDELVEHLQNDIIDINK